MPISLDEVLSFTPAKRNVPWGVGGMQEEQEPIKLPDGGLLPSDPEVRQVLTDTANKYKINPALLMALGQQESGYRADAVGPNTPWGKAKGMFQFLTSTAKNHGIDPLDYRQSADAAAKDLATQIAREGVDWAVAHHHAGPNKKLHGKKTKRYVREVMAKAQAIAKELGISIEIPASQKADFSNVSGSPKTVSLEAVLGAQPAKGKETESAEDASDQETLGETFKRTLRSAASDGPIPGISSTNLIAGPVARTIERGWEGIQNFLNRDTVQVERTDGELQRLWNEKGMAQSPAVIRGGLTFDQWAKQNRTATVTAKTFEEEEAEWSERLRINPDDAYLLPKRLNHLRPKADESKFAPKDTFTGAMQRIVANHKNPLDLMLQDSIPANVVTTLFTLPELERKKFDQARAVSKALEVTNNPDEFSEEERAQAGQVVGDWRKQVDGSIAESWNELYQAAKEDPSQIGLAFSEALIADPYMLAAPVGIGMKPVRALQAAQGIRAATIAGRAGKIADRILDAGSTAAAINVAAGAAENLATTGTVNDAEVKLNAAVGFLLGGSLGPVFMKGARAKGKDLNAARLEGTLEETLRDAAKADVELEATVRKVFDPDYGVGAKQTELQTRLGELLGIIPQDQKVFLKEKDFVGRQRVISKWLEARRKEIKASFKEQTDYADYQTFVAKERMARAEELAREAEARSRARAEAAWGVTPEDAAVQRARMQEEFDAAIIERNAQEETATVEGARKAAEQEDAARTIAQQLDAEEMYYALLAEDAPAVRQAENAARRRDSVLKTPKWQRGSSDPETLARLGVAGAGAAAAYAAFPEDQKLQGALLGGLAGLVVPAGGSVLSRMRQSGAIAGDGQIIAALTKAGKLATKLDEAEIKARDGAWMDLARSGNQAGFKNLYDAYFPKIKRFSQKYMGNRETSTGLTGEDIAQQAFMKAYQKLIDEPDFEVDNFPGFVTRIAETEALQALRKSTSQREGANVVNESQTRRFDDEGSELSNRSLMDTTEGSADYNVGLEGLKDTPELTAIRDEAIDIIRQVFEAMPEQQRNVMSLVHLEHYSPEEAAKQLGISHDNVRQILSRGEKLVRRSIEENRRKLGEPVTVPRGQRGSADVDAMKKTAMITATALGAGTAGYFLYDGDPWRTGVLTGMGATAGAMIGGKGLAKALRGIDYRMRDFGPTLYGLAKKHGFQELKDIRKFNNETANFITQFSNLPENVKPIIIRALSTRDKGIINKMLNQVGGKAFVEAFDKVRVKLDEVEDQLVHYGLIKKSEKDYFPFRVKDLEGLRAALGKEASTEIEVALKAAEDKMQANAGRPLNDIERGVVINKILEPYLGKAMGSTMPGFAKARTIQDIPEHLQKFYFDPVETLNSYGVQAVKYIERAKFFGRNLVKRNEGGQEFVDIDKSIGQLVDDLRNKGELNDQQAFELADMLRDRFGGGEKSPHPYVQGMKNLVNASLLGHISSAAVQIGDLALQALIHGPRAGAKALARQALRKKQLDLSNFGLNEHVAHEFLSDNWTRKVADWSFKWGGFRAIDAVGKNFGLNAAVDKMMRLAKSVEGERKLADQYQRYFPDEYKKALTALKKGEINEEVELLAFADLTQTQPLTQWELPQFYHKYPNGRVLYHLQTFSMRVLNMVYERAVKDMVSGDVKRFAKGTRNLVAIGAVLGVQGVATDKIKDLIAGRPIEINPEDVPINAVEALGMSMYDYNRMADKGPLKGMIESKLPPILRMSEDILNEPERSMRYLPVAGRLIYDRNKAAFEARRKERRKKQGYKMEITVKPSEGGSSSNSRGGRGGSRGR